MDAMLIPTLLCPKAWEGMSGDETTRFCSYCQKHVHNLEAMSVSERLKLLSSPAASLCARYKIAIRRPAPGKKESYMRHLLKYGASVALAGSVLVVLWEMYEESNKAAYYRAVANSKQTHCEFTPIADNDIPEDLYEETSLTTLGFVDFIPEPRTATADKIDGASPHVDIQLDPVDVDRLINQIESAGPNPKPIISLKSG